VDKSDAIFLTGGSFVPLSGNMVQKLLLLFPNRRRYPRDGGGKNEKSAAPVSAALSEKTM
jgi:hypothetical protein